MTRLLIFTFFLLTSFVKQHTSPGEDLVISRIRYVRELKAVIDCDLWPTINDKAFDVPVIYYTDSNCYVFNPAKAFLKEFEPTLILRSKGLRVYRVRRLDGLPFHMETGMHMGDQTESYSSNFPYMHCSGVEESRQAIPGVQSTEEWITMVMHEYFHGFQYRHPRYISYLKENVSVRADSLAGLYHDFPWYKAMIEEENGFVLEALKSDNEARIDSLVSALMQVRTARRTRAMEEFKLDVGRYERCYETMEGTARYVETGLYKTFTQQPIPAMLKADTAFKNFNQYHNFRLEDAKGIYMPAYTSYFYATGYNLTRLLEKLKIPFKNILFETGGVSLEELLINRKSPKSWK
jgi:hypothetical protein